MHCFRVTVDFAEAGTYDCIAIVSSPVGEEEVLIPTVNVANNLDCEDVTLKLQDAFPIDNPLEIDRSVKYTLFVVVTVNCNVTAQFLTTSYTWEALKIGEESDPVLLSATSTELTIDAKSLEYGLNKITFTYILKGEQYLLIFPV